MASLRHAYIRAFLTPSDWMSAMSIALKGRGEMAERGRVYRAHRNFDVMHLLWKPSSSFSTLITPESAEGESHSSGQGERKVRGKNTRALGRRTVRKNIMGNGGNGGGNGKGRGGGGKGEKIECNGVELTTDKVVASCKSGTESRIYGFCRSPVLYGDGMFLLYSDSQHNDID
eukprot:2034217-Rhodomonas_salina.1